MFSNFFFSQVVPFTR